MFYWITPRWFAAFKRFTLAPMACIALISLVSGLYYALIASPIDYQQGAMVRAMYIHVPAAWLSIGLYTGLALASLSYLVWKNPMSDIFAAAIAPIGAVYAAITLVTGALWGKPIWGTYWVWDARLTSMLLLFLMYVGYIILRNSFDNPQKGKKSSAIIAILGLVNLPIIKWSVEWWNTLHQPASIMRLGSPAIASEMLYPLITMALAHLALAWVLFLLRAETLLEKQRLKQRSLLQ